MDEVEHGNSYHPSAILGSLYLTIMTRSISSHSNWILRGAVAFSNAIVIFHDPRKLGTKRTRESCRCSESQWICSGAQLSTEVYQVLKEMLMIIKVCKLSILPKVTPRRYGILISFVTRISDILQLSYTNWLQSTILGLRVELTGFIHIEGSIFNEVSDVACKRLAMRVPAVHSKLVPPCSLPLLPHTLAKLRESREPHNLVF